jgi:hypothetical protein
VVEALWTLWHEGRILEQLEWRINMTTCRAVKPWLCAAIFFCAIGCTTTQLEYDRMTSTAFPPNQTVDGETVTLECIYLEAGKLLIVNEDDTSIAALAGDTISDAELETIEIANRSSPVEVFERPCGFWIFRGTCRTYYAYGIVVNHFGEDSAGNKSTSLMGRMFTSDNRRAFANFYKNSTVSGNGGKYLRSAAHELGHAFNLHHEDGDGSSTIMNQTGVVGDDYVYAFSATSRNHLDNHPAHCVFPGMGRFLSCVPDHPDHVTEDCEE